MDDIFLSVVLPIISTQIGSILLFWVGMRERKPKQRVDVLESMEDLSDSLAQRLRAASSREEYLMSGIRQLLRQLYANNIEPIWRPNGNGQER